MSRLSRNYWVDRADGVTEVWMVSGAGVVRTVLIDTADRPLVERHSWNLMGTDDQPHARATIGGKDTVMQRVFMGRNGSMQIDHINGDPLDNRRVNLRWATPQQNYANRRGWSKHGYKGVAKVGRRWRAMIRVGGQALNLGSYQCIEDAAMEYDIAALRYQGEYAWLNFPLDGEQGMNRLENAA